MTVIQQLSNQLLVHLLKMWILHGLCGPCLVAMRLVRALRRPHVPISWERCWRHLATNRGSEAPGGYGRTAANGGPPGFVAVASYQVTICDISMNLLTSLKLRLIFAYICQFDILRHKLKFMVTSSWPRITNQMNYMQLVSHGRQSVVATAGWELLLCTTRG